MAVQVCTSNSSMIPNDLYLYIFSCLSAKDLSQVLLVCKLFKQCGENHRIWEPIARARFGKVMRVTNHVSDWKLLYRIYNNQYKGEQRPEKVILPGSLYGFSPLVRKIEKQELVPNLKNFHG